MHTAHTQYSSNAGAFASVRDLTHVTPCVAALVDVGAVRFGCFKLSYSVWLIRFQMMLVCDLDM